MQYTHSRAGRTHFFTSIFLKPQNTLPKKYCLGLATPKPRHLACKDIGKNKQPPSTSNCIAEPPPQTRRWLSPDNAGHLIPVQVNYRVLDSDFLSTQGRRSSGNTASLLLLLRRRQTMPPRCGSGGVVRESSRPHHHRPTCPRCTRHLDLFMLLLVVVVGYFVPCGCSVTVRGNCGNTGS